MLGDDGEMRMWTHKKSFKPLAEQTVHLGYKISAGPVITAIECINMSSHSVSQTVHIAHACVHVQCSCHFYEKHMSHYLTFPTKYYGYPQQNMCKTH